jgi:hypothetical protein
MVTAVKSETQQTITVPRSWIIIVQARHLLYQTTDISQNQLGKIDRALRNQWIELIGVYGLDSANRCHVGLELSINWETYKMQIRLSGETVTVKKTFFADDNLIPVLDNCIRVFNNAVLEAGLRTEWFLTYPESFERERINQNLGFHPSTLTWAGKISKQVFSVAEFPELSVTFSVAVPEPEKDEEQRRFDQKRRLWLIATGSLASRGRG